MPDFEVVVIGAGAGGICAGVKLLEIGVTDFLIVDRDSGPGGTWRSNTYPDVGADLPVVAYQFSFAPKHDWDRFFAKGDQIQEYHVGIALKAGLDKKMRFNTNILTETWDEENHEWRLLTETGETITTRFLISAIGAYINPKTRPNIPGVDSFTGTVMYPAGWNHDYDFTGKKVAIVGVGSSTVQIGPALAPQVERLDIYQRTTQWYFPKPDFKLRPWMQQLLRIPRLANLLNGFALAAIDIGLRFLIYTPKMLFNPGANVVDAGGKSLYNLWLRYKVKDPETRKKLRPKYGPGCTRGTLGGSYLPMFNRENVDLITTGIQEITPDGIRTADGVERKVDALVLATGYEMFSDPESYREGVVIGRDGFDLGTFYNTEGLRAYLSTSVSGLPNRFMMVGPYSWTGTAFHAILEIAMRHIAATIAEARDRGVTSVEVRPEAQAAFHQSVVDQGKNLAHYFSVHCAGSNTYFVNSDGESPYVRPWTLLKSWNSSTGFDRDDYEYRTLPAELTSASSGGNFTATTTATETA